MSSSEHLVDSAAGDWLHFVGLAGSGMSALAHYHAQLGGRCSGSDRALDLGERAEVRRQLETVGVKIVSQDGSFLTLQDEGFRGEQPAAIVVSTAVENKIPDLEAARKNNLPILHRSELLAQYVASHRTIAISGTSGKSTVTAMVFTILCAAKKGPGLLTGGPLASLVAAGHLGNAWAPTPQTDGPPWLVIEADESDGSLVRYRPWAGVILNLGLDHKKPAEIMAMFATFRENVTGPLIVADQPALAPLQEGSLLFGVGPGEGLRTNNLELLTHGSAFTIDGVDFRLQVPGLYNVWNATAAVAAAQVAGVPLAGSVTPLQEFTGVARRFQSVGHACGIEVIDDFAHNPDKIAAALAAAQLRSSGGRILAVFQPHGYEPTRFLREALVDTFAEHLRVGDKLWLPEIFFAGGTVTKNISAGDLVREISQRGRAAAFIEQRDEIPDAIAAEAKAGDVVLVMGARDPSLTSFCREILAAITKLSRS